MGGFYREEEGWLWGFESAKSEKECVPEAPLWIDKGTSSCDEREETLSLWGCDIYIIRMKCMGSMNQALFRVDLAELIGHGPNHCIPTNWLGTWAFYQ